MKRKIFEFGDDLAAAFEGFCADRGLVEKRVVESMVAYFMQQTPGTREEIMMTLSESAEDSPTLRVAAKKAVGQKSTPMRGVKSTPVRKPKT